MSFPSKSEMHQAHARWQSQHGAWMGDVDRWRTESATAIEDLKRLEELYRAHDAALRAHAEEIRRHGDRLEAHEVALAEWEQGGLADRREAVVGQHFAQCQDHAQHMIHHEKLGLQHRTVSRQLHDLMQILDTQIIPEQARD